MKKETKLVISIIKSLAAKHPDMSFKYEYVPMIGHVVEVDPLEMYNNFELYGIDENEAQMRFIRKFPDKCLMFVSNDPYDKVEHPIFQLISQSRDAKSQEIHFPLKSFWSNLGRALGF